MSQTSTDAPVLDQNPALDQNPDPTTAEYGTTAAPGVPAAPVVPGVDAPLLVIAADEGGDVVVRWFGQWLPAGYRPVGVVTATADIVLTSPAHTGLEVQLATLLELEDFSRVPGGLREHPALQALFTPDLAALRAALATGSLATMDPLRAIALVRANVEHLEADELAAVVEVLPEPVWVSLFVAAPYDLQLELFKSMMGLIGQLPPRG